MTTVKQAIPFKNMETDHELFVKINYTDYFSRIGSSLSGKHLTVTYS
jgi:hypothetical protein